MNLKYSNRALDDVESIVEFIARDSRQIAQQFGNKLLKECRILKEQPLIGRSRDELSPGLRSLAFRSYLIFYSVSEVIVIERILHGAVDLEQVFKLN